MFCFFCRVAPFFFSFYWRHNFSPFFYSLANFFYFELCGGDGVWFLHNVKKLPEEFSGFVLKIYSSVLLSHSSSPIASSDFFGVPDLIC
ncbi:hypothetical protein SAMN05216308_101458 [Nitrosospira sp. Nsp13]|nr:hypothetical protein SAMN05216308_101458 [Nitrosospira sp. Nsp13]